MEFARLAFNRIGRQVITVLLQLKAGGMPGKCLLQLRAGFCALSFQRQIVDQPERCGFVVGIGREQFAIEPVRFAVVFPIAKNLRQFQLGITAGRVRQQNGVQQTYRLAILLLLHINSRQLDLQFFAIRKLDQSLLNERKGFLLIVLAQGLLALRDDLRNFLLRRLL